MAQREEGGRGQITGGGGGQGRQWWRRRGWPRGRRGVEDR